MTDFVNIDSRGAWCRTSVVLSDLTADEHAAMDKTLTSLETRQAGLLDLSVDERRALPKMGNKSEASCCQTLMVLAQNPKVALPGRDLFNLDELRSRIVRIRQLKGRFEDSEMALGSDVMSAALEGDAWLKVMGKCSGLGALRYMALRHASIAPLARFRARPLLRKGALARG